MRRCKTCQYFLKEHCYRYPPVWIQASMNQGWRPPVAPNDGCGEFKQRPTKSETDPDKGELVEFYEEKYRNKLGEYPIIDVIDRKALASLLSKYGLERAEELIESFLTDPPNFYRDHALFSLKHIPKAITIMLARGD